MDLNRITFADAEDRCAIVEGRGLPFSLAHADIRILPGEIIIVTLRADIMAERARLKPKWWHFWRKL